MYISFRSLNILQRFHFNGNVFEQILSLYWGFTVRGCQKSSWTSFISSIESKNHYYIIICTTFSEQNFVNSRRTKHWYAFCRHFCAHILPCVGQVSTSQWRYMTFDAVIVFHMSLLELMPEILSTSQWRYMTFDAVIVFHRSLLELMPEILFPHTTCCWY